MPWFISCAFTSVLFASNVEIDLTDLNGKNKVLIFQYTVLEKSVKATSGSVTLLTLFQFTRVSSLRKQCKVSDIYYSFFNNV